MFLSNEVIIQRKSYYNFNQALIFETKKTNSRTIWSNKCEFIIQCKSYYNFNETWNPIFFLPKKNYFFKNKCCFPEGGAGTDATEFFFCPKCNQ